MSVSKDDEFDLGRPSQRRQSLSAAPQVTPVSQKSAPDDSAITAQHDAVEEWLGSAGTRAGDLNWNRPRQAAPVRLLGHVSAAELEALERQEAQRRLEEEIDNELASELVALPNVLATSLSYLALLLMAGVLGLFVLTQVTATLVSLAAMPMWIRLFGYGCFTGFTLLTLYTATRLTMLYWRLKTHRQIPLKGLKQLSERRHLRLLATERLSAAQAELVLFLQKYPLEPAPNTLRRAGLTASDLEALQRAQTRLLDQDRYAGATDWIENFRQDFQHILDAAAQRRIKHHAWHVAVKTAASPYPLLDVLIAAVLHMQLLTQLCTLYNLRLGWTATTVILARIFFSSYLSGQIDNAEDYVAEQVSATLGEGGIENLILSKFTSKAAAGLFNYKLLTRLGQASVRLLQPVASST